MSELKDDDVLTVDDVKKHLGLGTNNAYKLFQSSTFPSYKIGTHHYIRREAYEQWFNKLDNKKILI